MAEVAHFKPQLVYIGLQCSLQAKWLFVQRVTADMHEQFLPLVVTIVKEFLPLLLGDDVISPIVVP